MTAEHSAQAFKVVVNHEDQYSLWPAARDLPLGWMEAGATGSREQCLAFIRQTWTDMRPNSLRQRMDAGTAHRTTSG
ncbi:MbtH protein [Bradyrhizobium diazoefficiens]